MVLEGCKLVRPVEITNEIHGRNQSHIAFVSFPDPALFLVFLVLIFLAISLVCNSIALDGVPFRGTHYPGDFLMKFLKRHPKAS